MLHKDEISKIATMVAVFKNTHDNCPAKKYFDDPETKKEEKNFRWNAWSIIGSIAGVLIAFINTLIFFLVSIPVIKNLFF